MSAGTGIPRHALLACEALGPKLSGEAAAAALARGMTAAGAPGPDVLPLPGKGPQIRAELDERGFDERMRASRAVVLLVSRLQESTLEGSATFEVATRARQSGVPCYAVTAANELDSFDLRILDLQVVIEAATTRALSAAGRRLAELI
ncbi:MAG TPA: hypothetical protein VH061_04780 [Solirubrobacteraceae bacterium]|nr:hypothetical protein [Solirubrobacteraceae bacterium]